MPSLSLLLKHANHLYGCLTFSVRKYVSYLLFVVCGFWRRDALFPKPS